MTTAIAERFTQTDPMPLGAGSAFESSYVYGLNNPLVYTDPSGLRAQDGPPNALALTSNPIASVNPCTGKTAPTGNYAVAFNGGCFPVPNGSTAVTNSKGELGYVPSKYCGGRNDSTSQCTITGLDVFRDSGAGKAVGNPVVQGLVTFTACSTGVACAPVAIAFASYNASVRVVDDGLTKKTIALGALDFALAAVPMSQAKSARFAKSIVPGSIKYFPYGTNAMEEIHRTSAGRIVIKNIVIVVGTGGAGYAVNEGVK